MRLSLLKADTNIFCVRGSIKPNTSYYFPFRNIPLKTKNKPFKSLFPFRGGIIAINEKNAIEVKRGVKKAIFLISFQVYQRYQDEKSYPLNIIQQKLQILQKVFYPLFSFNSSISFCILPALFKLNKKPYNENEKDITSISSAIGLSILKNAKKLPLNPADHKIILSLMIEYSAFKVSNFSFETSNLFIIFLYRTDLFFYIINDFGFLVVIKENINPFWSFVFSLPSNRYRFFIKTAHISKLFYSQFALFKFIFEVLIIHFRTFKKLIYLVLYQNITNKVSCLVLTYLLIKLYNFDIKTNLISFYK